MPGRRKVLVVGSGGREHALALRLLESDSVGEVLVTPGNAGTHRAPPWLAGKALRSLPGSPLEMARREAPDLTVIGPEAPLCEGLTDELAAAGHLVFGPSLLAARLEGSKAFMKELAGRHGVPTARYRVVRDPAALGAALDAFDAPPVVKADGLCAGKGVVVAESRAEAERSAARMLSGEAFGEAGRTVVLEERLSGAELSVHAIADGERFVLLPPAQDHKRLLEGDRGPNTGGMGTLSPSPLATPALVERVGREIIQPTLAGMAAEGHPFRGALFAGIMVKPDGVPSLLEFNVRFGDPETQVLTLTLEGDFCDALVAAARGELDPNSLRASGEHAVCVVLAAHGYPEAPRRGDAILGLSAAEALPGVRVFHAGTALSGGAVVTAGGRVLGVAAKAGSLGDAHARAYEAVALISFDGMQFRTDVAAGALGAA